MRGRPRALRPCIEWEGCKTFGGVPDAMQLCPCVVDLAHSRKECLMTDQLLHRLHSRTPATRPRHPN